MIFLSTYKNIFTKKIAKSPQHHLLCVCFFFVGGVHFDMRIMNRVGLVNDHMAVLGPGGIVFIA